MLSRPSLRCALGHPTEPARRYLLNNDVRHRLYCSRLRATLFRALGANDIAMSTADLRSRDLSVTARKQERRRRLRFPFTASVELVEPKSGARLKGRTSDLGPGGCYVDTPSPLPAGEQLSIRIAKDNDSFQASAKVIYSQTGMGMGLAFTSALQDQVKVLQKWLAELNGQTPPAVSKGPTHNSTNSPESSLGAEHGFVLSELLIVLMRKGVLDEQEGKSMLRKLNR